MIVVYKVGTEPGYQQLAFDGDLDAFDKYASRIRLDGLPKRDIWEPPPLYSPHPLLSVPDIWTISALSRALGFSAERVDQFGVDLYRSGELLDIEVPDIGALSVLNVTEVVNCLDVKESTFSGRGLPSTYAFHAHRLPDASLFKVPQSPIGPLLCLDDDEDFERQFKRRYETFGLRGLNFVAVWDSETGPRSERELWGLP